MSDLSDFLERLLEKLSQVEVPFMLVGSVAASYHGHPRSTLDVDLVIDADEETLCRFARSLGEGYYVSEGSVRQAVRSRTAFNVIDEATGYKADLIVRNERPFSRTEFSRRIAVRMLDKTLEMATPEDVILSKRFNPGESDYIENGLYAGGIPGDARSFSAVNRERAS
jgi:hypothetical protein